MKSPATLSFARLLWFGLMAAGTVRAGVLLLQGLAIELQGAVRSDGLIYMIVGRGLLNGLRPWVDLFETKPPGIFLLSALSLAVTGDERLAMIAHAIVIVGIPVALAVFGWNQARGESRPRQRYELAALGLLLGTLLAFFLDERAGGFQTEAFGAGLTALYVLSVSRTGNPFRWQSIATHAALLLGAMGFKEPFLLTAFASVFVLRRSWKDVAGSFCIPAAIACCIGAVILAALGWLHSYWTLYLPNILHLRLDANIFEPLWLRGFQVGRIFGNLARFSTAPLFGWTFALIWFLAPALKSHLRSAGGLALTLATSSVAYFFLIETGVFLEVIRAAFLTRVDTTGAGWFIALHVFGYCILTGILVGLLEWERRKRLLADTLSAFLAMYLTSVAVGLTNYDGWHWSFALPVLFALCLVFLRFAGSFHTPLPPVIAISSLAVIASLFISDPERIATYRQQLTNGSPTTQVMAQRLDQLLDQCRFEAYYATNPYPQFAFAKHSPLGPLFFLPFLLPFKPDDPLVQMTYENIRDRAQLIVVGSSYRLESVFPDLASEFTATPPDCAAGIPSFDHQTMYFRKRP